MSVILVFSIDVSIFLKVVSRVIGLSLFGSPVKIFVLDNYKTSEIRMKKLKFDVIIKSFLNNFTIEIYTNEFLCNM